MSSLTKVSSYKFLLTPFPDFLKEELRRIKEREHPNLDTTVHNFIQSLKVYIVALTKIITRFSEIVIERAEERGILVTVESQCCHAKRCSTCLGRFPLHYPYFRVTSSTTRLIRKKDLRQFLTTLNFTGEEINGLLSAIDARAQLLKLHNTIVRALNHIGVIDLEFEFKE